jgi:hypothetical protein
MMAVLHHATISPTKAELIAGWVPSRPWGPPSTEPIRLVGSFRFDDPEGRVGLETHLVAAGDALFQVPVTYRDAPLTGAEDALITTAEHSVLGTRWVYDGLRDPVFVLLLAAFALTGQGEALNMFRSDEGWVIAPSNIRIHGGGWTHGLVAVDGFEFVSESDTASILHNDRFELTVFRRPVAGARPEIGITADVDGSDHDVVLAQIAER